MSPDPDHPVLVDWWPPGYQWDGATSSHDSTAYTTTGNPLTLTLDRIPVDLTLDLTLEAVITPAPGRTVTVDGAGPWPVSPTRRSLTWHTVNFDRPLTVRVTGAARLDSPHVTVSVRSQPYPHTDRLLPAHVLALESRTTLSNRWTNVLPYVTAITTRRGISTTSPARGAEPGTMTIHIASPWLTGPSLQAKFQYASPIRLYDWRPGNPAQIPIWAGYVSSMTYTPYKGRPGGTATVEAADAASLIGRVTRYGATVRQTVIERVKSLAASMQGITVHQQYTRANLPYMQPTVWETSIASHLDALTASISGTWYVQGDGSIYITDTGESIHHRASLTITDGSITTTPTRWESWNVPDTWYYSAIDPGWSTSAIISAIRVTNHGAVKENNQWRAADTTHTATNTTNPWGGQVATADTTLTTTEATTQARALLRAAHTAPSPRSVTIPVITDQTPSHLTHRAAAAAAAASPGQAVTIEHARTTTIMTTTTITHTITPTTWTTRIELD